MSLFLVMIYLLGCHAYLFDSLYAELELKDMVLQLFKLLAQVSERNAIITGQVILWLDYTFSVKGLELCVNLQFCEVFFQGFELFSLLIRIFAFLVDHLIDQRLEHLENCIQS